MDAETVLDYFVTAGCSFNGDGSSSSCAAGPGGAGAFDSCSSAELGARPTVDLVTDDIQVNIYFSQETSTPSPDTVRCVFNDSNWGNGDATRYVHLRPLAGQEHPGFWDDTKYHMEGAHFNDNLEIRPDFFRVTGLQIRQTRTGSDARTNVLSYIGCNNCLIDGNLLFNDNTEDTAHNNIGYGLSGIRSEAVVVTNNVLKGGDDSIEIRPTGAGDWVVYNNTFVDALSRGIRVYRYDAGFTGTVYVRNNIAVGGSSNAYQQEGANGSVVTSANFTTDATSPDGASFQNKTFAFSDEAAEDYRLSSSDTSGAIDGAGDLSSDPVYSFSLDALGTTRTTPWDAGAFDEPSGSGSGGGSGGSSSGGGCSVSDSVYTSRYAEAQKLVFSLRNSDCDYISDASFTAGDVLLMKDEAAFANTVSLPATEGEGFYSLDLTALELTCERCVLVVKDQTDPAAWLDMGIKIFTYGSSSAFHSGGVTLEDNAINNSSIDDSTTELGGGGSGGGGNGILKQDGI